MQKKEQVYQRFNELGIAFEAIEHPAVFTIEEMNALTRW